MKEKINILYFENAIGWGGAAICLKLIAEYLDKEKYHPIITTPHNSNNYLSYRDVAQCYYVMDKNIEKKKLLNSFKFPNSIASAVDYLLNLFPYIIKLSYLTKKEHVDLIHLNNDPVCNMAGVVIAKLFNIPCISHVRGPATWNSKTTRWLYKNIDFVITVADWVRDNVIGLGVPENKVKTINDGRILRDFTKPFNVEETRKGLGLKSDQLSVGMIGLLIPWKGHQVFIDAAKTVADQYPECKLLIIGEAPDNYKDYEKKLKAQAQSRGLKNLFFTGHRDDIPNVMRVLDIIVHASVEPDPYPNVVIEGMAAGRAIVSSKSGGPIEMLEDYKTGILVPPNEPKILAEKICELLSNTSLRQSLGMEAKKVALERYSIEKHVEYIERVYEKILSEQN